MCVSVMCVKAGAVMWRCLLTLTLIRQYHSACTSQVQGHAVVMATVSFRHWASLNRTVLEMTGTFFEPISDRLRGLCGEGLSNG